MKLFDSHVKLNLLIRCISTSHIIMSVVSRFKISLATSGDGILGDQGAVSRFGRKGGTKVFKLGRKSPGYRLSPSYFSWVLFVSSYTTAIVLPHLPGSFTKLVRTRETFIFYFLNQKRRNYRWVANTFGMLSAGVIQFAPRIFCFWLITVYRK